MKFIAILCVGVFGVISPFKTDRAQAIKKSELIGAWERETDGNRIVWINTESHFSAAVYSVADNSFVGTCGGKWKLDGNKFSEVHEFNTMDTNLIGKELVSELELKKDKMIITVDGKKEEWKRIDNGTPGQLAGAWLITGRYRDGELTERTPGARRTMKILSGTKFQWIAYNVETKEFFGTGGGSYATKDGKYTENIEFFSRDNSRVGASLEFDYKLENGKWRHSGLSSKGDPLDEVWTRREVLGI